MAVPCTLALLKNKTKSRTRVGSTSHCCYMQFELSELTAFESVYPGLYEKERRKPPRQLAMRIHESWLKGT